VKFTERVNGTVTALPYLVSGDNFSKANATSSNGSLIVGFSSGSRATQAVWWINDSPSGLGFLSGYNISSATGVSSDRSVIVGWVCNPSPQ